MLSPWNKLLTFFSTDYFLIMMKLYCLNLNLVLYLHTAVILQSMVTLIANYCFIKILLDYLFGTSTCSYLSFLWYEIYFSIVICKFYDLMHFLHVFHSTAILHHYLLQFLHTITSRRFSAYISLIYKVSPQRFQEFWFLLSFHYILLTYYSLK